MKRKKVLVLRTCRADLTSHEGKFKWKEKGVVKALDWKPVADCGNGLHGLLNGEGDGSLLNWDTSAKWLVVEVDADRVVDLQGKVKFPEGKVVFCGTRFEATNFLASKLTGSHGIAGYQATAGYMGTATAGYMGTATAGDRGTIEIAYYDDDANRQRKIVGYIGEKGLKAGVKYKLNDKHEFEEVK